MPPPSVTERNRMKAFVEQTGNRLPGSPQKHRRGDQSPDTAFTENLESLNIIQPNNQYGKVQDDVFDENVRPPSVQGVDRRSGPLHHLFTGSELSEGFMRSGLSSPTSEPSRRVPVKYVSKAPYKPESKKPPRLAHGGTQSLPTLTVGSDFRMTVTEPQHNDFADMKDGFSAAGITHPNPRYPGSPVRNSHRHHHHHRTHQPAQPAQPRTSHKREPVMPIPQPEEEVRGRTQSRARFDALSPAFTDSDDGPQPTHDNEDVQTTPRGKQLPMRNRVHYSPSRSPVKQFGDRKRRRKSLDYDDQALNTMEYQELLEQPFDFDPATASASGNSDGHSGDGNQRLAQMRHMGSVEQQRFFGDMSVDEWESAGNWLSEQFTGIMWKLTAARQSKRRIVDSFELEAAAREAEVRRRSDKIDEKLQKMREDGMKVVGGGRRG
ncbi:hypothetical protein A9K55_004434 [Cordyceps militaris]|uniref:Extracellular mutant protein 11 C-terminal domain-containing protein n=1 Tax=Cordyceps militaris TaxID=73501 RepID=A0A2H4SMW4_CORMI|nr:hypothetical protein A9K55_004434 [Cordyceps militaris]